MESTLSRAWEHVHVNTLEDFIRDESRAYPEGQAFRNTYEIQGTGPKQILHIERQTPGGPITTVLGALAPPEGSHTIDHIVSCIKRDTTSFFGDKTLTITSRRTRVIQPHPAPTTPPARPAPMVEMTEHEWRLHDAGFGLPLMHPDAREEPPSPLSPEQKLKLKTFIVEVSALPKEDFASKFFELKTGLAEENTLHEALEHLIYVLKTNEDRDVMLARGHELARTTIEEYGYHGFNLDDLPTLAPDFKSRRYDADTKALLRLFATTRRDSSNLPRVFQELKESSPHAAAAIVKVLLDEGMSGLKTFVRAAIEAPAVEPTPFERGHPAFTQVRPLSSNAQTTHPATASWTATDNQARLLAFGLADAQIEPSILASLPSREETLGLHYENVERAAIATFADAARDGESLVDAWLTLKEVSPKGARLMREKLRTSGLEAMLAAAAPLSRQLGSFISLDTTEHASLSHVRAIADLELLTAISTISERTLDCSTKMATLVGKLSPGMRTALIEQYNTINFASHSGNRFENVYLALAARELEETFIPEDMRLRETRFLPTVSSDSTMDTDIALLFDLGVGPRPRYAAFRAVYDRLAPPMQARFHEIAREVSERAGFEGLWDRSLANPTEDLDSLLRVVQLTTLHLIEAGKEMALAERVEGLKQVVLVLNRNIVAALGTDQTLVNRVYKGAFADDPRAAKTFVEIVSSHPATLQGQEHLKSIEQVHFLMQSVLAIDLGAAVRSFEEEKALARPPQSVETLDDLPELKQRTLTATRASNIESLHDALRAAREGRLKEESL